MKVHTSIILFGALAGLASGLTAQNALTSVKSISASDTSVHSGRTTSIPDRRRMVKDALSVLCVPLFISGASASAFADVSDGNTLPQGAAQFGRVLRAKSDLEEVQKRVAGYSSEMDKKEWDNVGQFLRKVYATTDDMKSIAAGFYDPDKKKKAATLIDDVKKLSKSADASTGSQNGPEFLTYSKKVLSSYDEFLELLQDVPDEL